MKAVGLFITYTMAAAVFFTLAVAISVRKLVRRK